MSNILKYPKLREPLDIRIEQAGGEQVLYINCPLGVSDGPLLLAPAVGPIISYFDGTKSISEITNNFSEFGVTEEFIAELVNIFNNNHFLDTKEYHNKRRAIAANFAASSVREPALAEVGYPTDAKELKDLLNSYINGYPTKLNSEKTLISLVSPHIDYFRGGDCYGATYSNLNKSEHDLFIVIGTAHQYSQILFHLTQKDFRTPFGLLTTDKNFVEIIAKSYGKTRSFADEILHRREHSLELQLPFLAHRTIGCQFVPILVSTFYNFIANGRYPEESDEYEDFLNGLIKAVKDAQSKDKRICFVAGVDMAHVGPAFGDNFDLTQEFLEQVKQRDREYIQTIINKDKRALFDHIAEDGDVRRICGFPTMYTLLDLLDRLEINYQVEEYSYQQAANIKAGCAVSFAGLGLYLS